MPNPTQEQKNPPNPPAPGGGADRACPRCRAEAGSPCVDRNGKPRGEHAARTQASGAARYDEETERRIAALPSLDRHQVHGAVATIRWAQEEVARRPEVYPDLPKPVLTPQAIAEKAQDLYGPEFVTP